MRQLEQKHPADCHCTHCATCCSVCAAGPAELLTALIITRQKGINAMQHRLSGASISLRSYGGLTVTGMSGARGSSQLTLHLQSPAAAAAAQHAAEEAAATVEAAATWQVHQVRQVPSKRKPALSLVQSSRAQLKPL
jgi:hypothetical protein